MNYYRIRLPKSKLVISGCSEDLELLTDKDSKAGFIYSEFTDTPEIYLIPADRDNFSDEELNQWTLENDISSAQSKRLPYRATTRDEHLAQIEFMQKTMQGWLSQNPNLHHTKIIAARIAIETTKQSIGEIFDALCENYEYACVFLFSTSSHGTWIGASPEPIIICRNNTIESISLAGTRWRSADLMQWDKKNIEEQQIVTDFILKTMSQNGMNPLAGTPYTLKAGPVEHIATEIKAAGGMEKAIELISELAPTPALSGFPRKEAIEIIKSTENRALFKKNGDKPSEPQRVDRRLIDGNTTEESILSEATFECTRYCYGGVIGILLSKDEIYTYANLRSGRIYSPEQRIFLYSGGGITLLSDPSTEWEETEKKINTLKMYL